VRSIPIMHRSPVFLGVLYLVCAGLFASCSGRDPAVWKTPADEAQIAKLETASLKEGLSRSRRAKLFFLWGQELAVRSNQGGDSSAREQAIGAFERVVDLDSVLVGESRFNLEILWRQKDQQEKQDQQNKQDQNKPQDGKQDRKDGKQDQQNGKPADQKDGDQDGKQADQKSADKKPGEQKPGSQADAAPQQPAQQQNASQNKKDSAPKDLSALVRDKEQSTELDKALKQESERRAEQQQMQAGTAVPVEKDW